MKFRTCQPTYRRTVGWELHKLLFIVGRLNPMFANQCACSMEIASLYFAIFIELSSPTVASMAFPICTLHWWHMRMWKNLILPFDGLYPTLQERISKKLEKLVNKFLFFCLREERSETYIDKWTWREKWKSSFRESSQVLVWLYLNALGKWWGEFSTEL